MATTRARIVTLLEDLLDESDVTTSEVGEQRERNYRYYTLEPLGNEQRGRSHYIDPAVISSVEYKKALFSETFFSSREVVSFSPGRGNQDEAKAKGAYVKKVFKDNHYERLFRDGWHDAFVAKRFVLWVDWEDDTEVTELTFQGAPTAAVNAAVQNLGTVVNVDGSQLQSFPIPSIGPQQYVHTGVLRVEVDAGRVDLELPAPEKFYRDPHADYPDTSLWNTMEIEISKGALKEDGYDPDQVDKLTRDYTYSGQEEDFARKAHDQSYTSSYQRNVSGEQQLVTIYKTRIWTSLEEGDVEGFEGDEEMRLYEIHWAKGKILKWKDGSPAIKAIDEMYVYEWAEMKVSHAEYGLCTADVEAASQKNLSILKRGIIDNMQMVNNTRYEAVMENLNNPRDLLDNVIGGVIDSQRIGSVAPLAQPPLSPQTFPAIEMLTRDSEERSGVSSLAKGMNSDVLKNQNADNMVERLTNAGTRRVTAEARDFARTFMIPVMQCIVKLGMKYDKRVDQMESGGRVIEINPQAWQDDVLDMDIAVALTPEEAQRMAQQTILIHQLKSNDEQIGPMYGPEQRHAFYDALYELIGIKDATPYLLPPESPQYQQAMQMQNQQAQEAQAMQAQQVEFQKEAVVDNSRREWAKINNDLMDTVTDNELNQEKFELETFATLAEINIEEEQGRAAAI